IPRREVPHQWRAGTETELNPWIVARCLRRRSSGPRDRRATAGGARARRLVRPFLPVCLRWSSPHFLVRRASRKDGFRGPPNRRRRRGMRTSKFTPEQMVAICRQGESGVPIVEVCRQHGISEQTYYRWKKQLGDISTAELKELRQLRDENRKLKTLVADLTLDKTILREALTKKF